MILIRKTIRAKSRMRIKEIKKETEWYVFIYIDEFNEGMKNADYFIRVCSYKILWDGNQKQAWTPAEIGWITGVTSNPETMAEILYCVRLAENKMLEMNQEHGLCNI